MSRTPRAKPLITNAQAWANYDYYTSELTKFGRQIAFGGVAICWLFKQGTGTMYFPRRIYTALACIVLYCVLDVAQYYLGAQLVRWWIRRLERRNVERGGLATADYASPDWLDLPAFVLFNVKFLVLAVGFVYLWLELWAQR